VLSVVCLLSQRMSPEPSQQQFRIANVRFGSKADIKACLSDVPFTPNSGH
jgi:hypothetical protein